MKSKTFRKEFKKALSLCKETYDAHREERADLWRKESVEYLLHRMFEEFMEYIKTPSAEEATDIVNFALMLVEYEISWMKETLE